MSLIKAVEVFFKLKDTSPPWCNGIDVDCCERMQVVESRCRLTSIFLRS